MGYSLGIDLGATTCAAAIRRGDDLEPCAVGETTATMPAVVLVRDDGSALVGEDADRASWYEPTLVARMVADRLGQPGPIVIDGTPCDPLALTESLLAAVVRRAAASQGAPPDHVVVTYPLRPGDDPELLLAEAAARAVGPATTLVPAPIAAVAKLAHDRELGPDAVVAVVDVGGSSVDVTLVRRTDSAFDLLGEPASLTEVGGADLDAMVLSLVEGAIGDVTSSVGHHDHAAMLALRRVRTSCREAKERLSTEDTAVVEVAVPHARGRVEITRDAFERAAEPALADAVGLLLSTIDRAGLTPADVSRVLLAGGCANIPRLAELASERTGISVVVDAQPELTVAQGAALFADLADEAGGLPGPVTGAHAAVAPGPTVPSPVEAPEAAATSVFGDVVPAPGPLPDLAGRPIGGHSIFDDPAANPTGGHPILDDPAATPPGGQSAVGPAGTPTGHQSIFGGPVGPPTPGDQPIFGDLAAAPTGDQPLFGAPPGAPTPGSTWPPAGPGGRDHTTGPVDRPTAWDPPPAEPADWADDLWRDEPVDDWPDPDPHGGAARTSVFGAPPAANEWATAATPIRDHDGVHDEFQRLKTSDTDPFGSRSGALAAARRRERDDAWHDGEDEDGGALDVRLVVGGVAVALLIVLVAGFALLSGSGGGNSPAIAVADTADTTERTTTTTTATPSTTAAPSTTEATTTTTEQPTTTTRPRPRRTTTTTAEPTPPPPPPTAPPTAPPTTPPTAPSTTTSTTTSSTTTTTNPCEQDDPPPWCERP